MFDPYYKWLGIRPEHQPPDHYRLLGLERFESDRDVIQAAGERQTAHIQSYKIGPQSELSQKILNEIARAKVCLLNPASKSQYDATLRAAMASQVVPPPPALRPAQPPAERRSGAPDLADQTQQAGEARAPFAVSEVTPTGTPRPYRKASRKRHTLPLIVIAVCVTIIVGAVGSTFVLDFSGNGHDQQAVSLPTPSSPRSGPPPNAVETGTSLEAGHAQRSLESPAATRLPATTPQAASPRAVDSRHPIPTGEQVLAARSKFTIRGTLTPAITLDAARKATHPWTRYALFQMTVELAFQSPPSEWDEAKRCALEAASLIVTEFQVPNDFSNAIASQFQRRPAAAPEMRASGSASLPPVPPQTASSTRPLTPTPGESKAAEPSSDLLTIEAPLIDLTRNQSEVRFKPLVAFEPRNLVLRDVDVANGLLVRQYPESGQVELGSPLRVVLRDQPPRAGLEISLHGTSELYLRIQPMIQDPGDVFYPWTNSGIRQVRGKVNKSIRNTNRQIELLTNDITSLTAQADVMKGASASRAAISEKRAAAEKEVVQLRQELQKLNQFLLDLDKLEALTGEVDRRAHLKFEVVRVSNGEELPIVRALP